MLNSSAGGREKREEGEKKGRVRDKVASLYLPAACVGGGDLSE